MGSEWCLPGPCYGNSLYGDCTQRYRPHLRIAGQYFHYSDSRYSTGSTGDCGYNSTILCESNWFDKCNVTRSDIGVQHRWWNHMGGKWSIYGIKSEYTLHCNFKNCCEYN